MYHDNFIWLSHLYSVITDANRLLLFELQAAFQLWRYLAQGPRVFKLVFAATSEGGWKKNIELSLSDLRIISYV